MAYYDGPRAPQSSRNHFVPPPSILDRLLAATQGGGAALMQLFRKPYGYTSLEYANTRTSRLPRNFSQLWQMLKGLKGVLNVPNLFIVAWIFVLLWGERWIFANKVNDCDWKSWERWVGGTSLKF